MGGIVSRGSHESHTAHPPPQGRRLRWARSITERGRGHPMEEVVERDTGRGPPHPCLVSGWGWRFPSSGASVAESVPWDKPAGQTVGFQAQGMHSVEQSIIKDTGSPCDRQGGVGVLTPGSPDLQEH